MKIAPWKAIKRGTTRLADRATQKLHTAQEAAKKAILTGLAVPVNANYAVTTMLTQGLIKKMLEQEPSRFKMPQEEREVFTREQFAPLLSLLVEKFSGQKPALEKLIAVINEGSEEGLFYHYGHAIFINRRRLADLLTQLNIPEDKKDQFIAEAESADMHLIQGSVYSTSDTVGLYSQRPIPLKRGVYTISGSPFPTRDGQILEETAITNPKTYHRLKKPVKISMIPGIFCNDDLFRIETGLSSAFAYDLADKGYRVSFFNPRGVGPNRGSRKFDPNCTIDTIISNDLPAYFDYTANSQYKRPSIVIGYSMGGMESEFALIRHSYKLQQLCHNIGMVTGKKFNYFGKTRAEISAYLEEIETSIKGTRTTDKILKQLSAEAATHLAMLNTVKGLITLGSPKIFDKYSHPLLPILLHLLPALSIIKTTETPAKTSAELAKRLRVLPIFFRLLSNAENYEEFKGFVNEVAGRAVENFANGVGLQYLMEIFSGKGMRRIEDGFNYAASLRYLPKDIPIIQVYGNKDPLANPEVNLPFIDHQLYKGSRLSYSSMSEYPHDVKKVATLHNRAEVDAFEFGDNISQVVGIVVPGVNHFDFLNGQASEKVIRPLLNKAIDYIEAYSPPVTRLAT